MKNIILVEGKTDAEFVKILTKNASVQSFLVEEIGGSDFNQLATKLKVIKTRFEINPFGKLGIILDLDNHSNETRLKFINSCLIEIFGQELSETNTFQKFQLFNSNFEIACFFIDPNLDVLLKNIANQHSKTADCLISCLENDSILQKEREKAWLYYYMQWDICNKVEREKSSKKVNFEYTLSKNAWNLESPELSNLKKFLVQFDK